MKGLKQKVTFPEERKDVRSCIGWCTSIELSADLECCEAVPSVLLTSFPLVSLLEYSVTEGNLRLSRTKSGRLLSSSPGEGTSWPVGVFLVDYEGWELFPGVDPGCERPHRCAVQPRYQCFAQTRGTLLVVLCLDSGV